METSPPPVMSHSNDSSPGPRRPLTLLAWSVIILVCTGWILLSSSRGEEAHEEEASNVAAVGMQDVLLGRIVVGLDVFFNDPALTATIEKEAQPLHDGTPVQRLAWVILQARLHGVQDGLDALGAIEVPQDDEPMNEEDVALVRSALVTIEGGGTIDEAQQEVLIERFDYFGELLIGISDPTLAKSLDSAARIGAIALLVVVCIFAIAGGVGFIALIILFVMRMMHPPPPHEILRYHGLYAETFAVWLVLFFGLQLLIAYSGILPLMTGNILGFVVSLCALAWPCFRGVPWWQVRTDIGWTKPKNMLVEPFVGLGAWGMALPFMGAGLLLTFVLTWIVQSLLGDAPQPSHPVQQEAMGAGAGQIALLFFIACVAAPIVEETFFRGVLYTHLRSASARWGFWLSIAASMVLSAFVFAAIHPQGLLFAPPLMGLAVGFAIAREWRGSLVAAMVAHSVNNALVMTLNVILFA